MVTIKGSLIQSFQNCKRQAWLMAHNLTPDQDHPFIEMGRIIDKESYSRDKKAIRLDSLVIDIIQSGSGEILIGEIKKSSKSLDSAKMQLAFYLFKLKTLGVELKGELLIPKEKRRIPVELTPELEKSLKDILREISYLVSQPKPPEPKKIGKHRNCGYKEFCWS